MGEYVVYEEPLQLLLNLRSRGRNWWVERHAGDLSRKRGDRAKNVERSSGLTVAKKLHNGVVLREDQVPDPVEDLTRLAVPEVKNQPVLQDPRLYHAVVLPTLSREAV